MGDVVSNNLGIVIPALMQSESCSRHQIAFQMGTITDKAFHTNDIRLGRFFDHESFEVEDKIWRCHIALVFQLLRQSYWLDGKKYLLLNLDFTSIEDRFSILSVSLQYDSRSIPLFFNMRLYPKHTGMSDQKKLEKATLKALKHLLPRGYTYVLVEDRGFCNQRFLQEAEEAGFEYIIRSPERFKVTFQAGETTALKDMEKETHDYGDVTITRSGRKARLITSFQELECYEKKGWYLFTSLQNVPLTEVVTGYSGRFKIEKVFQDQKTGGFNLEKSKFRKYIRVKRLLFCIYNAQALMTLLGEYIYNNVDELKKKPLYSSSPISAFLH